MPTPTKGARLGGSPTHQRLMLANLATALFEHGRITTTEAKAKRLRPFAERLISKARRADLHHRREVMKVIRDKDVVHKLFAEIGPHFVDRPGGYTRIVKTMPRKGDNAPMAVIELVAERTATAEAEQARGSRFAKDQPAATPAPSVATDAGAAAPAEGADEAATGQAQGDATGESGEQDAEASVATDDEAAAPAEGADRDAGDAAEAVEQATPAAESPASTVPQESEDTVEQADLSQEKDDR